MEAPLFSVRVPATTANLGPGFDSLGLALALYMTVEVNPATEWEVQYEGDEYARLPKDENNLIVQTILEVAKRYGAKMIPHQLSVISEIPLGKGLGSSATAIAAGIEIANGLFNLALSPIEKVRIGSELEGHADNVAAALLGGIVVTYFSDNELEALRLPSPRIGAVILVPPKPLKTEESRDLLPKQLVYSEAVAGSSASTMFMAAVTTESWELAGRMMERDVFHEPYRKKLLPYFEEIRKVCREHGAYGMTISGAGPSLFVAVPQGRERQIAQLLELQYPYYKAIASSPAETGAEIVSLSL